MNQRGIAWEEVEAAVRSGTAQPDAAPAGASPRVRITASIRGRRITIIVAEEPRRRVVITCF
jgi:hypothetical protein